MSGQEVIQRLAERSTAAQGLPERVEDIATLTKVATLLEPTSNRPHAEPRHLAPARRPLASRSDQEVVDAPAA